MHLLNLGDGASAMQQQHNVAAVKRWRPGWALLWRDSFAELLPAIVAVYDLLSISQLVCRYLSVYFFCQVCAAA